MNQSNDGKCRHGLPYAHMNSSVPWDWNSEEKYGLNGHANAGMLSEALCGRIIGANYHEAIDCATTGLRKNLI